MADTAAAFSWVIVPPVQKPSVWKSMSNTCGLTAEPPLIGTAEMFTLIPPVLGYRHAVPLEFRAACNWYCHRVATGGCQQAPTPMLQATGGAHPPVAQLAWAGVPDKMAGTKLSTVTVRTVQTMVGVLWSLPIVPPRARRPDFRRRPAGARMMSTIYQICGISV